MKPRPAVARILAALLLTLLTMAPAQAAGALRRGNAAEPEALDPHKLASVYDNNVGLDLFEGLTSFGPDATAQPAVAKSWTVSDDGMTYTFTLRLDLEWSDGAPITADDVVFSFRRMLDPKTAGRLASVMYVIKNGRPVNTGAMPAEQLAVVSPKPDTIVITLEGPAPYFLDLLAGGSAAIVPRHVVEKFGDAWIRPGNQVGNGAFVLKTWEPHNTIVLTRNPNYREPVTLDTVIFDPTEDLNAAVTRYRGDGLDMLFVFPSSKQRDLEKEIPDEVKVSPSPLTYYIPFNLRRPYFTDIRVRRALALAVDRELLVSKVLRGGQIALATYVPPGIAGYEAPVLPGFERPMADKVAEAKALMAAAGYTPEKPLRFVFTYANTGDNRRVAITLAAMWKPIGVQLVLEGTEGKVMYARLREGDFDTAFTGWQADYPDPATFLTPMLSNNVEGNYSHYDNKAYDDLLARAAATADRVKRLAILQEAEVRMLEDQPIIPMFRGVNRELISTRVHGWEANPPGWHLSRYLSVDRAPGAPQ